MGWMKNKDLICLLVFVLILGFGLPAKSSERPEDFRGKPSSFFEEIRERHYKERIPGRQEKGQIRKHPPLEASLATSLSSSPTKITDHQANMVTENNSWSVNDEIVFVSNRGGDNFDLWKMNSDGSNPTQLTDDSLIEFWGETCWSPDGNKIAYIAYDGYMKNYLMVVNGDGSGKRELVNVADGDDYIGGIAWSPDSSKIAYGFGEGEGWDNDYNIWVINADGTGNTQLTTDGQSGNLSWSPDGTKIVYHILTPNEIYIMDLDGSNKTFLTEGICPVWSPDGQWIAHTDTGAREIILKIRPDGTDITPLTDNKDKKGVWTLAWTPDSSKIIYGTLNLTKEVWVITSDGRQKWQLLPSPPPQHWERQGISPDSSRIVYNSCSDIYTVPIGPPVGTSSKLTNTPAYLRGGSFLSGKGWSPDGNKILYHQHNTAQTPTGCFGSYWLMNKDGSGKIELPISDDTYVDNWSPDSSKIAYVFYEGEGWDNDYNIWVINADGTGNTQLTTDGRNKGGSSWSPDGTKIVYHILTPNEIYIMDSDGSNKTFLTEGLCPAWSPDSQWIVYCKEDSPHEPEPEPGIWKIRPDGRDATRLTSGGYGGLPVWSPDGTMIAHLAHIPDNGSELRVVTSDGTQNWLVLSGNFVSLSWSPDSSRIAFCNLVERNVYMININGTGLTKINAENTLTDQVNWSSQNVLAYQQNGDIWVNDVGGSSISGKVTEADETTPIEGVTVKALQNGTEEGSATTDASGNYTIPDLPADTYTVTPSKAGYTFSLGSQEVTVPPDATGIDFTGTVTNTTLFVSPATKTVGIGSTFTLDIELSDAPEFDSLETYLSFDPNILEVTNLAQGPFPQGTTVIKKDYDNQNGKIDYAAGLLSGTAQGSGTVLTITFKAKGHGTTDICFDFDSQALRETRILRRGIPIAFTTTCGEVTVTDKGRVSGYVKFDLERINHHLGIEVTVSGTGLKTETDENGYFAIEGVPPGTYQIATCAPGASPREWKDVTISSGTETSLDTLILLNGDVDGECVEGNYMIDIVDFVHYYREHFGKTSNDTGWNDGECYTRDDYINSDFNGDGKVDLVDFSGFFIEDFPNRTTPCTQSPAAASPSSFVVSKTPSLFTNAGASATFKIEPQTSQTNIGETFTMKIVLSDAPLFDALGTYLSFDPGILEVTGISPGSFPESIDLIISDYDNQKGEINYTALHSLTQGSGTVLTITFKVKTHGSSEITFDTIRPRKTCILNGTTYLSLATQGATAFGLYGETKSDLNEIVVYPNPFKPNDGNDDTGKSYDGSPFSGIVFANLSQDVTIKVFNLAGELVNELSGTGRIWWDAKNKEGKEVASGVYIYLVTDKNGQKTTGKFTIIR